MTIICFDEFYVEVPLHINVTLVVRVTLACCGLFNDFKVSGITTTSQTSVCRRESFPSKESDTKILQSIYFAY